MLDFVIQAVASVLTLWGIVHLSRGQVRKGNWVSLVAQVPWWVLIYRQSLWGLVLLELPLTVVYAIACIRDMQRQRVRDQQLELPNLNLTKRQRWLRRPLDRLRYRNPKGGVEGVW